MKNIKKFFAVIMVLCVAASLLTVSVSAAESSIDFIGNTKSEANLYDIKSGAGNKLSVKSVSDLAAGEVEYKGAADSAYFCKKSDGERRSGLAVDFGGDVDLSGVYGKTGNYKLDMWLWVENAEKISDFVVRLFEKNTYKTFVEVQKSADDKTKVKTCGEYRLTNQVISKGSLVNGWNHVKVSLSALGIAGNTYESEAYNNFRNGDKTACAMCVIYAEDGVKVDYAVASARLATEKQIKADYPEEYEGEDTGDANDLDGDNETESKQLIDKIAQKKLESIATQIEKGKTAFDGSEYTEEIIQKIFDYCKNTKGLDVVRVDNKIVLKGSDAGKKLGANSVDWVLIAGIAGGALVIIAAVVVLIIVLGKKKKAPVVQQAPVKKDEE